MTDTAITAPKSVAERVSERIRSTYVELIAEDEWKGMVERELQWFLDNPLTPGGSPLYESSQTERKVSPVRQLIRQDMERRFKEMVKAELDKPEYDQIWEGNGYKGGQAIQDMTRALTPDLVQQLFQGVLTNMVQQVRSLMQQNRI